VGPTQSGKTSALAVPAILEWDGPVVAASVKSDLLRHTVERRSTRGRIWCIDPTGATGARASTWTPLTGCSEWAGARRMAADLAETAKSDGTTADGEFWYATAAKLLSPLLFAAARDGRTMADVLRWVDTQEAGEVSLILEVAGVTEALDAARASWCRDERTRSSVYTTAETILAPFAGPWAGGGALSGIAFEPDDLLSGSHTVYLCAPAHDQRRLRGYFTALTQQVLSLAFSRSTLSGRPLSPPLLVVLDEAAHIAPLPELDGLAATCASHGIQLVTVWQDLAQVRARYGSKAPTVLNNHRAKIFLPGIADPDTLDYASRLVGDEEVSLPSVTRDARGGRSTTQSQGPRRLLPPEELRCLRRGEAILIYGTLPPARLHLRPWWADRQRRGRWRGRGTPLTSGVGGSVLP
jgi:type IV secretion system protein VirD4